MSWVKKYEEYRKRFIKEGYCPYDAVAKAYAEMRRERNERLEKEEKEMIEPEEVEEDDFDDEISEERLMLMEMRNEYKRKDCDSIGWTEDKKNFYIVMYQDTVQRSYYAKLDGNDR